MRQRSDYCQEIEIPQETIADINDDNNTSDNVPIHINFNEHIEVVHEEMIDPNNANIKDTGNEQIEECTNCFRRQSYFLVKKIGIDSVYHTTFFQHTTDEIRKRKCQYATRATNENNTIDVQLCFECSQHLTSEDKEGERSLSNV